MLKIIYTFLAIVVSGLVPLGLLKIAITYCDYQDRLFKSKNNNGKTTG